MQRQLLADPEWKLAARSAAAPALRPQTAANSMPSVEASAGACVIRAQWPVPTRPNLKDRVIQCPSSLDRAPWQERVTSDHLPAAMVQGALQGRGLPSENGGNVDCRGARPAEALPGKRRSSVTCWPLTTAAVAVAAC